MSRRQKMAMACAAVSFIVMEELSQPPKKRRKKRQWWTSQLYINRTSNTRLLADLLCEDGSKFENFTRMSQEDFIFLLNGIRSVIQKKNTYFRDAIPAEERLAIALRFLASGDSYTSLQSTFRVSRQLISRIVPEVCRAIVAFLQHYIKMPQTEEEWKEIADGYESNWQFPHCIGSIDGKHCVLQQPACSGSEFINYKQTFSIVLMAAADADYNFHFVDIGCQGRISDGGIFNNCELFRRMQNNELNLPGPSPLTGRVDAVPYVFLGDAAFPLSDNLMKPYGGDHVKGSPARIFNYRLSRARRIIENAFGILSVVFHVLQKPMLLQSDNAALIVMTTVCLHNFLRRSKTSRQLYTPPGTFDTEEDGAFRDGSWRADNENMSSFSHFKNIPRRSKRSAEAIRQEFTEYFCNEGAVSWQDTYN